MKQQIQWEFLREPALDSLYLKMVMEERCKTKSEISEKFVDQNSFVPLEVRNLKNCGVGKKKKLQIPELHSNKFPTPETFSCWKTRFKTEVWSCSNFTAEFMLWIKEVEMAASVDVSKNLRDPFRELRLFLILNYWTQEVLHP